MIFSRINLVGLAAALLLSGCIHYEYTPLTEAQVIHFAGRALTKAGIQLADYEPTPVLARHGEKWSVVYHGKAAPADGSSGVKDEKQLRISVDNLTGAAQVLPGDHAQRASDHTPNPASRPGWPPPVLGATAR